jgi:butyryl-CoA dehydrogenase
MNFELSESHQLTRDTFARFSDQRIAPAAAAIDDAHDFPRTIFRELGRLGLFGLRYPETLGGSDVGLIALCLAVTEVARASLPVAAAATMQSLMGTHFLHRYGHDAIHDTLLKPAIRGAKIGGICITEPDAGSDLSSIATAAARDANGYRLNGQKTWITMAPIADFFTVFARAGDEKKLTIFLIERDFDGVTIGRTIEKMGCWPLPTAEVFFDNCIVPQDYRLGEEGDGERALRELLDEIRIVTGALAVGAARGALDEAVQYAAQRIQFGKPINRFQAVQLKLAEMATDLEAAAQFVNYAAWLKDADKPHHREAAMVKLFATERAIDICDKATRILGSYGYASEFAAQRHFRDVRFTLYGGGTNEILKMLIARTLTLP